MSIGDVNSSAPGSGARYNDGKPAMELIPLGIIAGYQFSVSRRGSTQYHEKAQLRGDSVRLALNALGCFQLRTPIPNAEPDVNDTHSLFCAIAAIGAPWEECAAVLNYGRKKYAEWNWLKGMPWSVPIACAARHLMAIDRGEWKDPESGLSHRGHVLANLVMLVQYMNTYRQGDDRPTPPPARYEDVVTSLKSDA